MARVFLRGERWAVQFSAGRTEGKAVQAFAMMPAQSGSLVAILNAIQGDQHVAVKPPRRRPTRGRARNPG